MNRRSGDFLPGCGSGVRDPDGGAFTYLDNDLGRAIAQRFVTAWAVNTLLAEPGAAEALSEAQPADLVQVRSR